MTSVEKFKNEIMELLSEAIPEKKIGYMQSFQTYWIMSNEDNPQTEFRFVVLGNKLIVSRVMFEKRRQGIMTKCFEIMKAYSTELGVTEIVIQSVLTDMMASWCVKNGFTHKDTGFDLKIDRTEYECGDYVYNLRG